MAEKLQEFEINVPEDANERDYVLGLPNAARGAFRSGGFEISRFSREVILRMRQLFDHAESQSTSPFTATRAWPSAYENGVGTPKDTFSRLNTGPAHTSVNTSLKSSRITTHDSRPV